MDQALWNTDCHHRIVHHSDEQNRDYCRQLIQELDHLNGPIDNTIRQHASAGHGQVSTGKTRIDLKDHRCRRR